MNFQLKGISVNRLSRSELYWLLGLFIFSAVLGQLYQLSAVMIEPAIRADSAKYLMTAYNLVSSGSYSYATEAPLESSSLLVPGYPYFLALLQLITGNLDRTVELAFKLQILMGASVSVITVLIARRLLPFSLAFIAGFIICIYPHQIIMTKYLLTESLFGFLFALSVYFMLRSIETRQTRFVFVYALLLAFATLTRPITLLMLPFLAILVSRRRLDLSREFMLASLLTFLCWLPWSLWTANSADLNESNIKQVVLYGSYPDFTYRQFRGYPNLDDPDFTPSLGSWEGVYDSFSGRFSQAPLQHLGWYLIGKPLSLWSFSVVQGQGGPFIYPVESSIYDLPGLFSFSYRVLELLHPLFKVITVIAALLLALMFFFRKSVILTMPLALMAGVISYVTLFHIPLASLPRFSFPFQSFMVIMVLSVLYYCFQALKEYKNDN